MSNSLSLLVLMQDSNITFYTCSSTIKHIFKYRKLEQHNVYLKPKFIQNRSRQLWPMVIGIYIYIYIYMYIYIHIYIYICIYCCVAVTCECLGSHTLSLLDYAHCPPGTSKKSLALSSSPSFSNA